MLKFAVAALCLCLVIFSTPSFGQQKKKGKSQVSKTKNTAPANSSVAGKTPSGFAITLRLEDRGHNAIGAGTKFGIDSFATNCVDPKLGESYLPPNPPTGLPDLRWVNPRGKQDDCYDLGTNNDFRPYRNPSQVDTFKLQFQASADGYPVTVSWENLTRYFDGDVKLLSPLSGKLLNVDMKSHTSASVPEDVTQLFIVAAKPAFPAPPKAKPGKSKR